MLRVCRRDAQAGMVRFILYHSCWRKHNLSCRIVKSGAKDIQEYLQANYCPTVENQELCTENLAQYYIGMLVGSAGPGSCSCSCLISLSSSSAWLSTTSWVELFTSARLWGSVMLGGRENIDSRCIQNFIKSLF